MNGPATFNGASIDSLASRLADAADYLAELWPERAPYTAQLGELRARLVEQRLHIAVLGQFKRGKSTLLNALLGQPLLPTGVLPLTAIPTFIRWAPALSLAVSYLDRRTETLPITDPAQVTAELFRLVTEEGNPHNEAKVDHVDLALPASILRQGIVLIDTPGVGSTFQHNTDAAFRVLPACDAAFFVLSADPPVTAVELDYLDRVRPNLARLFFILNKIDYLAVPDRATAQDFLRRTLGVHMPAADIHIFPVSARQALEAKQAGSTAGAEESGLAAIERYLEDFLARDKHTALQTAIIGKAGELLDAARMDVALGVRALEMPIADLKARAAAFTEALRGIEHQRLVGRDLPAGDRRRALEMLEARAAALRDEGRAAFMAALERTLKDAKPEDDIAAAGRDALATAIPAFFGPKLDAMACAFGDDIERVLAQHVQQAARLIAAVRETAATLFDIPPIPSGSFETFVMAREPFWVTQKFDQTLGSLAGGALDKLLPARLRAARVKARLTAEIDDLVQRNVENLRWATLQSLEETFRRFSQWFDDRLAETIGATRGAIEAALAKRHQHEQQGQDELTQLRRAADWIGAARRDLADMRSESTAPRANAMAEAEPGT